jgi:hypothetical protein
MMLDQHVFQLAGDFVRRYGDAGAAAEAGKALDAAPAVLNADESHSKVASQRA